MQELYNCSTELLRLVPMLVILLSNVVIGIEGLSLARLSSEFSFMLSSSKLEEKDFSCICWLFSIVMSIPSVSLKISIILALDIYSSYQC